MTETLKNVSVLVFILAILGTLVLNFCLWVDPSAQQDLSIVPSPFVPLLMVVDSTVI